MTDKAIRERETKWGGRVGNSKLGCGSGTETRRQGQHWQRSTHSGSRRTAGHRGRQRASWLCRKEERDVWHWWKKRKVERKESSKSRDSIMQTTDSRPLHHHFPAFDVSLHSGSGDEQERGGCGGEEAMKGRRKSRQRYEKRRTQKPEGESLWWHHCLLHMEAAGGGVVMERREGRDGAGWRRDTYPHCPSPPPPGKKIKKITKIWKECKLIKKKITDRQWSCTASRHSIQPIQTNQNGSSSG